MTCVVCDDGYQCDGNGTTVQVPTTCDPGTFFNGTLDACTNCSAGSWCSGGLPGTQPRPCSRGTYAAQDGAQQCEPCPVGTFQNVTGATACMTCDDGYTCDGTGATVQVPTPQATACERPPGP